MPNTRLEAVLRGIGDGARLEQLVADLLRRDDYDVDPTGTRGPDGGRDALLYRDGDHGILHCSVSQRWEQKVCEDAEKASDRPEDFTFFIFATTQNPAGIVRDRVEDDLRAEYGWRTTVLDLERLRNQLRGDNDNHDLIRDHLSIDPAHAFQDPSVDAEEFYQTRIDQLQDRDGYYGTIASDHFISGHEDVPILAVHLIPAEAFGSDHDRLGSNLPDPPGFGARGHTQQYGDFVLTGDQDGLNGEGPFTHYSCFHEDGWAEAVTTNIIPRTDDLELSTTMDSDIVAFVEDALDWYQDVGINPPFYAYLTLISAEEYTIYIPRNRWGPDQRREFGSSVFEFGEVRINQYGVDVPEVFRKPLFRLWTRAGWHRSLNYNELEEDGDIRYEWDPRA